MSDVREESGGKERQQQRTRISCFLTFSPPFPLFFSPLHTARLIVGIEGRCVIHVHQQRILLMAKRSRGERRGEIVALNARSTTMSKQGERNE